MKPAPNRHRGEIVAELDGRQWTLCLTLGALADLEASFGAADLADLAARLGSGHLGAGQMTAIMAAGLRGGGHDVSDAEVAQMRCPGGLAGMARIVADLVAATFGVDGPPVQQDAPPDPMPNPTPPQGEG